MSGFNLDDYVDVAERIRLFYAKYPDGRLQTVDHGTFEFGDRPFVWCRAFAYRSADDLQPCSGTAWEPVPGSTPYTRDSELMNAETAAWGRAIIAAGIPSKKIASAEEVRNRQDPVTGVRADPSNTTRTTRTKPQNLDRLIDLWKSLAVMEPSSDAATWQAKTERLAARLFGEADLRNLKAPELQSVADETERWLSRGQGPDEDIPF